MLTEETTKAVAIMEASTAHQSARAQEAMNTLNGLCQDYFGVKGQITVLSKNFQKLLF